jgi:hypothetical protein
MARYHIYVLTVWQENVTEPDRAASWRFILENPRTGQTCDFADAFSLAAALQTGSVDNSLGWDKNVPQESDRKGNSS